MKSLEKKSKRFKSLLKDLDQSKSYKIEEAVKLIKDRSKTKFVESIDLSLNLNIEKTKSDQENLFQKFFDQDLYDLVRMIPYIHQLR